MGADVNGRLAGRCVLITGAVPATSFEQPPDAGQIDLGIIVPAGRKHGVEITAPPPAY